MPRASPATSPARAPGGDFASPASGFAVSSFQTAHHEYALEAFEHEALDYVVKPVKKERLAQALSRLGAALGYQPGRAVRLLVRHGSAHQLVPLEETVRLGAAEGGLLVPAMYILFVHPLIQTRQLAL